MDEHNEKLPEVNEAVAEQAAEPTEEAVQEAEKKVPQFMDTAKEKLGKFWDKVNPIKYEDMEEDVAPEEEEVEQAAAEEAPAEVTEEAPVRRKPADAFAIDFPVEEVPKQEQPEEAAEETAEETVEAPAEEAVETPAEEEQPTLQADPQPDQEEPAEQVPVKKRMKLLHWVLIVAGCVALLGLMTVFVLKGAGISLKPRENGLMYKDSYTADASTLVKNADTVVATIGDRELTVSELQLYYINGIYTFYSQNYYYMDYMGLDLTAPLDKQPYGGEEADTWEQYFLDAALKSWQSYTIVELLAEEEGFAVDEEVQVQIDNMASQLDGIAAAYGYASAADYLSEEMAPGVSPETYINFNRVYFISNEYINHFYEENYPDTKDINLYYKENEAVFHENGITPDMGLVSDVRHILIKPQGGVTDESGETTYSDEEWATALAEAERILGLWQEGEATEDSFATLANTYSMDSGSNTTGGLYEDVYIDSNYVPEFKNWAIDAARKSGDTEIVKTTYGYHIMYFAGGEDYFQHVVGDQLVVERVQARLLEVREAYPIDVNYKKIVLCESTF